MNLDRYILESISYGKTNTLRRYNASDAIKYIDTISEFEDFLNALGYVKYPDNSSSYALSKRHDIDTNIYFYEYRKSVSQWITVVLLQKHGRKKSMVEEYTM